MMINRRSPAATICLVGMVGTVLLVDGCSNVGSDAYSRARLFDRGATETELTQAAGPPTERLNTPDTLCEEAGGSFELVYKVSARYLGGWLQDAPMHAVAFCIDDSAKIVARTIIDW
jgi:hypothetical protein